MTSRRIYRQGLSSGRFKSFNVTVKETDLWIAVAPSCYSEDLSARVEGLVFRQRCLLEHFLTEEPAFATTLGSYIIEKDNPPELALSLARASNPIGVGPMAAVAGAFAEIVGLDLLQVSKEVVVENGGDLFVKVVEPLMVGIYAGKSPLSGKICLLVEPGQTPQGICTSSGTVGPSFSCGKIDAAVALSPSTPLADAAATALANAVKETADLDKAINYARELNGLTGALLICGDKLAAWGQINLRPTNLS